MMRCRSMWMWQAGLLVLVTGCGAASDSRGGPTAPNDRPGPPAPAGPVRPATDPPSRAALPAAAPYEVHEWGLLRAAPRDTIDAGAVAPPVHVMPVTVDKPILYFHATAKVAIARVRVEAVGGTVREHWPLTSEKSFPSAIEWRDLALDPAQRVGGSGCAAPTFPTSAERPCSELEPGELCESAQLAGLTASDANCLASPSEAKGATFPFLFYRSRLETFTPPLGITRLASGEVRVTNNGDRPIPGWIVRLRGDGGWVQTRAIRPPAPHASITISADFTAASDDESVDRRTADRPAPPGNAEPGRRALKATLAELGLTAPEIEAFMRAWDGALFAGGTVDGIPVDVLVADKKELPADSLLYFLPPDACDAVARLTFDPPPTQLRRALAVWTRF